MKKIFAISIIFLICTIGKTATDSNNTIVPDSNITAVPDTNTIADCQEKIKKLERVIESQEKRLAKITDAFNNLKKQLDEQIKENERMKALLPKDKINSVVPAASFDPNNGIIYHGKKRDLRWFNLMYNKFCDRIYLNHEHIYKFITSLPKPPQYKVEEVDNGLDVRGRPLVRNIREEILQPIQLDSEHIGSVGQLAGISNVITVINKGEILIEHGEIVIHIYGLDKDFYVGQNFPGSIFVSPFKEKWFINTGTFKYTAALGRHMTVPSLTPYPPKPLTKEQFAEAINSGIELIDENKQPVP